MFEVSFNILIIVLLLLAAVFLFIPVRKDPGLRSYRISLRLIAVSYLALALYCYYKVRYPQQLYSVPFLTMASLQAILLGSSHINLVNPRRIGTGFIFWCSLPLLVFLAAYAAVRIFFPHIVLDNYATLKASWSRPEVLIRLVWMAGYVIEVAWFAVLFFRDESDYRRRAVNWFSEGSRLDLKIVKASFVLALCVATVTIAIASCTSPEIAGWLNIAILALYISMGLLYIRYPAIFFDISTLIFDGESKPDVSLTEDRWLEYRSTIIERRLYVRPGLTLEQLAKELATNRNRLSALINKFEGMNFNAFINGLRIKDAIAQMEQSPTISLSEISDSLGYSEPANFSRQFRKVTGMSPQQYRAACQIVREKGED